MAAGNLLVNRLLPRADLQVGLGVVGVLSVIAKAGDLRPVDLGMARTTFRSGLRWGGVSAALVAAGYSTAVWVPAIRDSVAGSGTTRKQALVKSLAVIPLATVIPEEFAFRGVLWGLLCRESGRRLATAVSSALFGVWHVLPALGGGAANQAVAGKLGYGPRGAVLRVVGTVLFTGLAGVLLCELRIRSDSLLAPILLHWAVNGLGELFVQIA
jgi:membrane protease YdiL (CAAX protease family)